MHILTMRAFLCVVLPLPWFIAVAVSTTANTGDAETDTVVNATTTSAPPPGQNVSPSPGPSAYSPTDTKTPVEKKPKFSDFHKTSLNCSLLQLGQYPLCLVGLCVRLKVTNTMHKHLTATALVIIDIVKLTLQLASLSWHGHLFNLTRTNKLCIRMYLGHNLRKIKVDISHQNIISYITAACSHV